jgi:ABC-type phosphate/phosphonate transport system substrate-binding protein
VTIAALPMYDPPELQAANDALWAAIAARLESDGLDTPQRLTRGLPLEGVWSDPGLLLAQTCGYPLMTTLRDRVCVVATPRYGAPGCDGPFHRSAVVVRQNDLAASLADLRGRRYALNDLASNTGMNLMRSLIAPLAGGEAFFGAVTVTGAHAASAEAVAVGEADVAAIDCVTFALLQRLRPAVTRPLRVLAWTASSPGLPLITAVATSAGARAAVSRALADTVRDPSLRETREELLLEGFEFLAASCYDAVLDLERSAVAHGYPVLR